MARRATSLGPKPSLFFGFCFLLFFFLFWATSLGFLDFVFLEGLRVPKPSLFIFSFFVFVFFSSLPFLSLFFNRKTLFSP